MIRGGLHGRPAFDLGIPIGVLVQVGHIVEHNFDRALDLDGRCAAHLEFDLDYAIRLGGAGLADSS